MSEQSNDNPKQSTRSVPSELPARRDFAGVDCSGLARGVELLASGNLQGESAIALLRHELATVQRQASVVCNLLQNAAVELRQLRDSAQREQIQKQDEQRQLQDQNDRFVANLIQEHDSEMATLRRERDTAIDRIRELSRGMARVSASSSASMLRVSMATADPSAPSPDVILELRSRVDELLHERDRSLRLLRQLAEQRDLAEGRLQAALASIASSVSRSLAGVEHAKTTVPEVIASPNISRSPTLPKGSIERASIALAPENPEDWDLHPGPNTGNPESPSSADLHSVEAPVAGTTGIERLGAYSMHAEDLAIEEVYVSRSSRALPKGT